MWIYLLGVRLNKKQLQMVKKLITTFNCTTSGKINSINPPSEGFTFRKTNET